MASNQSTPQNRRERKFPIVSRRTNQITAGSSATSPISWLSFQDSLLWLRKNEQTISKCVQLLQVYPNLIQDKSLDSFWEFLCPFLEQTSKIHDPPLLEQGSKMHGLATARQNGSKASSLRHTLFESKSKRPSKKGIPSISVTETREFLLKLPSISSRRARTPRVHLVSSTTTTAATSKRDFTSTNSSDHLHSGALRMLQDNFFVRTANPADRPSSQSIQDNNLTQFKLSESDVCVFVFTDDTIDDKLCFHDLCTALALKIPVVFVRHHNQELPKTFAESIKRNSRGCVSLGEYIDKYVFGNYKNGGSVEKPKAVERRNKILPPFTTRTTRSRSASDLNPESSNATNGRRKHKASIYETELLLYLINNFKNSYIFDENDIGRCSQHLRLGIYHSIGITDTETPTVFNNSSEYLRNESKKTAAKEGNRKTMKTSRDQNELEDEGNEAELSYLNVPDADNLLLAREWSHSGSVSAPPCDDPVLDDHFTFDFRAVSPAPLEQKSTTYLVFDDNKASNKFRRVHFPSDDTELAETCSDMESDEFDPRGSPINFPDIDLAREVNELIDNSEFD